MKKNLLVIPMLCLLVSPLISCKKGQLKADLVVYNNIFTAEGEGIVEAFAVKDGKYIYVGNKEGIKDYIKEGKTQIIDSKNEGLVIPGATEGHGHYFSGVGLNSQLPGSDKKYLEVLDILRQQVAKGITQFISFGCDHYDLVEMLSEDRNFAEEIESVAPNIPVVLIDNSGHSAVCNKTALRMANIESDSIRGGAVGFDGNGKLNGFVSDQTLYYVVEKTITKPLSDEQYRNACEYGMNELLKFGYTNTLDAFTNMYHPTGLFDALKKMDDRHDLKINVAGAYNIRSYDSDVYQTRVNEAVDIAKQYSSKHFHPEYVKLFLDGVTETGTGWMLNPYSDGTYGNIIWNQNEFDAITTYANQKGLLIHAHAYGDAACKTAINSFIKSNVANNKQFRNCLAHVRNITEEDIIRAATNKISIASNLLWHTDYNDNDLEEKAIKDYIIESIGEETYYKGYPMKSLMEKGVNVSSSTDAPAAVSVEGNILNVLEVAVTGIEPESTAQAFSSNELLTIEQGLKALTINGAWQLGLDNERGSIKVGKYADFVILDKNILNYQGDQLRTIHNAKILNTYFEGESVYSNN